MHDDHTHDPRSLKLAKNRFIVLISGAIVLALLMVAVALALYGFSGAAQVDLSRPGYSGVRDKINETKEPTAFPSNGPIDKSVLDEYEKLYNKTADQVTSVEAFESGVLSDESLRINDAAATTSNQ